MKNTKELLVIHYGLQAVSLIQQEKDKANGLPIYQIAEYEVKINPRINEYFIEHIESHERFELKVVFKNVVHFKTNINKDERVKGLLSDFLHQIFWWGRMPDSFI